jgi:hypothetical protein
MSPIGRPPSALEEDLLLDFRRFWRRVHPLWLRIRSDVVARDRFWAWRWCEDCPGFADAWKARCEEFGVEAALARFLLIPEDRKQLVMLAFECADYANHMLHGMAALEKSPGDLDPWFDPRNMPFSGAFLNFAFCAAVSPLPEDLVASIGSRDALVKMFGARRQAAGFARHLTLGPNDDPHRTLREAQRRGIGTEELKHLDRMISSIGEQIARDGGFAQRWASEGDPRGARVQAEGGTRESDFSDREQEAAVAAMRAGDAMRVALRVEVEPGGRKAILNVGTVARQTRRRTDHVECPARHRRGGAKRRDRELRALGFDPPADWVVPSAVGSGAVRAEDKPDERGECDPTEIASRDERDRVVRARLAAYVARRAREGRKGVSIALGAVVNAVEQGHAPGLRDAVAAGCSPQAVSTEWARFRRDLGKALADFAPKS